MELLSFKLPVFDGNRIRLRSASPCPSSQDKSAGCGRPGFRSSQAAGETFNLNTQQRGHREYFKFLKTLQERRTLRHGSGVFLQAVERAKDRYFTLK